MKNNYNDIDQRLQVIAEEIAQILSTEFDGKLGEAIAIRDPFNYMLNISRDYAKNGVKIEHGVGRYSPYVMGKTFSKVVDEYNHRENFTLVEKANPIVLIESPKEEAKDVE